MTSGNVYLWVKCGLERLYFEAISEFSEEIFNLNNPFSGVKGPLVGQRNGLRNHPLYNFRTFFTS